MTRYVEREPYEGPDVTILSGRMVTAQREYECCHCHRPIFVGQRHYKIAFKHDGEFGCNRSHSLNLLDCEAPRTDPDVIELVRQAGDRPLQFPDRPNYPMPAALSALEAETSGRQGNGFQTSHDYETASPTSAWMDASAEMDDAIDDRAKSIARTWLYVGAFCFLVVGIIKTVRYFGWLS